MRSHSDLYEECGIYFVLNNGAEDLFIPIAGLEESKIAGSGVFYLDIQSIAHGLSGDVSYLLKIAIETGKTVTAEISGIESVSEIPS